MGSTNARGKLMPHYTIFTANIAFDQEADSPAHAIEQFLDRIKLRGEQNRSKIPAEREISPSLYEALVKQTLKLVVVSKETPRPRKLLGGFNGETYEEPVSAELARVIRRMLTEEEYRLAQTAATPSLSD
jgi:hypothetical protein